MKEGDGFRSAFQGDNNDSLGEFLRALKDFNEAFCSSMMSSVDFTLKLEVRGDGGKMLHARVLDDRWRRPKGAGKAREIVNRAG